MINNDMEIKKRFDSFVTDWKAFGQAIDELQPLMDKFTTAVSDETPTIATVEKYLGFLKIEEENVAAKNDNESNEFKKALYNAKGKLDGIVIILNACKSGLNLSVSSLKDIANDFKETINGHLTTINDAITKTTSYLTGYVPTEKEDITKSTYEPLVEIDDKTKDNIAEITDDTKVVGVEPQIKAVPLSVQTDSLDELSTEVDNEMGQNHTNIGELMATNDSYNSADEDAIDNSAPFNFDQMNLTSSDELTDSNELSNSVNIEEPMDAVKPTDDEIDISQWFANNSNVDKPDDENTKQDELSGSIDEVLNYKEHSDNVDDAEQQVVDIEPMFDEQKSANGETENKNNDYGLTLEKAS